MLGAGLRPRPLARPKVSPRADSASHGPTALWGNQLDRPRPGREVDGGARHGLAGAWDARGTETALAGRALAHDRRRHRAGGVALIGSSDRGGGRTHNFTYGYTTLTDQRGQFTFDRVVPGPGTVWRIVNKTAAPLGFAVSGWQERVEVKPTQTARVRIGGKGRPVIGRVVVDGAPEPPVDWTKNEPIGSIFRVRS
jgi:hypothetical protein